MAARESGSGPVSAASAVLTAVWPNLVAGREAGPDARLPVLDPDDGSTVAEVGVAGAAEVEAALAAAARATGRHSSWPADRRVEVLLRASRAIRSKSEDFAGLIAAEGVKTLREARMEVDRAAHTLALSAAAALQPAPDAAACDLGARSRGWRAVLLREPVGVAVCITPFNDPLNLVAHKVGPALAAGNAVVVKPDPRTPLSALLLARVLLEAGVPEDRLSVLVGSATLVSHLVGDRRVRFVSFTGGRAIGALVHRAAGTKRTLLELGGVCPTVVWEDADLDAVVPELVSGAFGVAGQNCLHVQRVLVHHRRYAELRERLVVAAGAVRLGPKADESTDMGPLIDVASQRRVAASVEHARRQGATVLTGGAVEGAGYLPTLVTDVPAGAAVATEEVFGPVTTIERVDDLAHCIRLSNAGDGGIQAGVFTFRADVADALVAALDVGGVVVGGTSDHRSDALPFGGTGSAGLGREGVTFAAAAMSELKTVLHLPPQASTSR